MIADSRNNSQISVLAFTGLAGAGKSTLAKMVSDKAIEAGIADCVLISPFAVPLKDFAIKLGWNGKKDKIGRRLLQLLGTEVGRDCIDPDIWLNFWKKEVYNRYEELARSKGGRLNLLVIVDDNRFENEAKSITEEFDGQIVRVTGRTSHQPKPLYKRVLFVISFGLLGRTEIDHISERGVDSRYVDLIVDNSGPLGNLKSAAIQVIEMIQDHRVVTEEAIA